MRVQSVGVPRCTIVIFTAKTQHDNDESSIKRRPSTRSFAWLDDSWRGEVHTSFNLSCASTVFPLFVGSRRSHSQAQGSPTSPFLPLPRSIVVHSILLPFGRLVHSSFLASRSCSSQLQPASVPGQSYGKCGIDRSKSTWRRSFKPPNRGFPPVETG